MRTQTGALIQNQPFNQNVVHPYFHFEMLHSILSWATRSIEKWAHKTKVDQCTQTDEISTPEPEQSTINITSTSSSSQIQSFNVGQMADTRMSTKSETSGTTGPPCPSCNERLVVRKAHRGGLFYGCTQWPRCKGSRPLKAGVHCTAEPTVE